MLRPVVNEIVITGRPSWGDVAVGCIVALIVGCLCWPLIFVFRALRIVVGAKNPETFLRRLGGESKDDKIRRLEREAVDRRIEVREFERRNRELERACEIS